MDDVRGQLLGLIKKYWFTVALLLIVLIALWYRMGIIGNYVVPTYGNTMYHVGIERLTVLTQYYPSTEISYGGGYPNFYVPAYRLLIVSMSVATGIDVLVMSGLMAILLGIMVMLALFAVAYRLSDNLYIALFAAFFFIMSPEITIFTIRPLPELLGLFTILFTLYFVVRKNWIMAMIGAALTALTHQMTLATLAAILGLYALFLFLRAGLAYVKKEKAGEKFKEALSCLSPTLAACVTYGVWQMYSLGTLSLTGTAQLKNHEGNTVDLPLLLRTGVSVLPFFAIGLSFILANFWDSLRGKKKAEEANVYGYHITAESALLIFAWIIATLILTFNDYINPLTQYINSYIGGIVTIPLIQVGGQPIFPIFMDRFFTFFVLIAIIVAGFGMYALLRAFGLDVLKVKP
jgi:hypothetical protein